MSKKYCTFKNYNNFWELFENVALKDLSDPVLDCENFIKQLKLLEKINTLNGCN